MKPDERGKTGAGFAIGVIVLLAMLGWIAAVLIGGHVKMRYDEAFGHRDAIHQINSELNLHRINVETILVPRFDNSLDIFINRATFESVAYPDRDEFAAGISDIWCNQVSSNLLPVVRFRDVQKGSTLVTKSCDFQSSPDISGNYSGVVHNNSANVDSTFEVQLASVVTSLRGCMQVDPPLFGTGAISGTENGRSLIIDLNSHSVRITFEGTRVGHTIKGHYTVTSNGQTGTFTLHQDVPRVDIEFNPSDCPR